MAAARPPMRAMVAMVATRPYFVATMVAVDRPGPSDPHHRRHPSSGAPMLLMYRMYRTCDTRAHLRSKRGQVVTWPALAN